MARSLHLASAGAGARRTLRARAGTAAIAFAAAAVWCGACAQRTVPVQAASPAPRSERPDKAREAPDLTSVLRGPAAFGDVSSDAPGVRRLITPADLPEPYASSSADNGPYLVARPEGAWPKVPAGFRAERVASGLRNPREVVCAPNGDLFVAESAAGRIRVLRLAPGGSRPVADAIYASGRTLPFGMAFYPPGSSPQYLYVADTDRVVRYPYRSGDLQARAQAEPIVPNLPGFGRLRGGGHWTRDIRFSQDGRTMYVSVGSFSNTWENPASPEARRADILAFAPDGSGERIYASGIRNAVGLAVQPSTGELWCSVNERDGLGDDLPPDYITRVKPGGFYGWPWYYIGSHQDPRHAGAHPELRGKVAVPDVLLQAHMASLCITFYDGAMFPAPYRGDAFAAQHGSWNRSRRTGYKVIRVLLRNGKPTGAYEDFMTGFVAGDGTVWGRPVGVAVAKDGALIVTDDGSNSVWRVSYARSR